MFLLRIAVSLCVSVSFCESLSGFLCSTLYTSNGLPCTYFVFASFGYGHGPASPMCMLVLAAVCCGCRCLFSLPGYYAVYTDDEMQCLEVEEGYFSLGGYGAQRISCPPFTSTNAENGLSVDLTHCLCKPGYAPASAESLADPTTPASLLKRWLLLNPFYASLQDTQVCMLCGRRHYKGRVSAEACIECPLNSFSSEDGPTDKSSCNMCLAGYYHTSNEDLPCGECQAHHFCVGSEPAVESLAPLAGDKIPCSDYTETIEPNSKNTDPFSCMYGH